MRPFFFFLAWLLLLAAFVAIGRRLVQRRRIEERLFGADVPVPEPVTRPSWLTRWLYLAGFRRPGAASTFVAATIVSTSLGAMFAWIASHSGVVTVAVRTASSVPGGIGDLAVPILLGGPWVLCLLTATAPLVIVRGARRRRVESVERELPLALETLATLSEAGLGFDAAIARLVESQPSVTPLVEELQLYQTEVLGGVSRVQSLRRLRHRLDVGPVTVFVSSLVQAEQVGAGLSEVLRRQAEDARQRNRERALIKAEALPTKLVFPLVICYLPGLFVTTLGPSIYQFARLADSFSRRVR